MWSISSNDKYRTFSISPYESGDLVLSAIFFVWVSDVTRFMPIRVSYFLTLDSQISVSTFRNRFNTGLAFKRDQHVRPSGIEPE